MGTFSGFTPLVKAERLANLWGVKEVYVKDDTVCHPTWSFKDRVVAVALTKAKELGFDSCPMEGFDPKAYKEILKLDEHLVPAVVCPVGYAADEPRTKLRFSAEDIYF